MIRDMPTRRRLAWFAVIALCTALSLTACAAASSPPANPTLATALPFTPLADAAQAGEPHITTIGYLLAETRGMRLVDAVSFAGAAPEALTPPDQQIWCGDGGQQVQGTLLSRGELRYAIVLADGVLEGPGTFGPDGAFRWQLRSARLRAIAPLETSIGALLDGGPAYARRLVRINGHLLLGAGSAVLIDKLGAGGIPEPGARQVKLRSRQRDQALEARLQTLGDGTLRTGLVQVEGYMLDGALTVLALQPLGS
jgi:hypothetical protein